jgi:hypothetical protein
MPTPIEKAREALAKGLTQLPRAGLRLDYTLLLRRWPETPAWDSLSMDPLARQAQRGEPLTFAVTAPDVKPASLGFITAAGGVLKRGDLVVKVPRTAAFEAFLQMRLDDPTAVEGGPYPELARVEFVINGEPHQAVWARPGALTTIFAVRRLATEGEAT